MAQLLSAILMGRTGVGAIEFAAFVAVIAILVMFVVETVGSRFK